jgi:hypothetical protein
MACAPYGEAAVQEALWGCVSTWLMNSPSAALTNPVTVAGTAVMLCHNAERIRLGLPSVSGAPYDNRFQSLSPDSQREALLVAQETMADWERAGKPGLNANTIKRAQQYVQGCASPKQSKETTA